MDVQDAVGVAVKGRDVVVDDGAQLPIESRLGRHRPRHEVGQFEVAAFEQVSRELVFAAEMLEERGIREARHLGDIPHARLAETVADEQSQGRHQDLPLRGRVLLGNVEGPNCRVRPTGSIDHDVRLAHANHRRKRHVQQREGLAD